MQIKSIQKDLLGLFKSLWSCLLPPNPGLDGFSLWLLECALRSDWVCRICNLDRHRPRSAHEDRRKKEREREREACCIQKDGRPIESAVWAKREGGITACMVVYVVYPTRDRHVYITAKLVAFYESFLVRRKSWSCRYRTILYAQYFTKIWNQILERSPT